MSAEVMRLAEFGGVNLADHPRDLADNEFAWAENIYPFSPSTLRLRGGSVRVAGATPQDGDRALALLGYNHSNGRRYIYLLLTDANEGDGLPHDTHLSLLSEDETGWGLVSVLTDVLTQPAYNPAWAIWRDRIYLLRGDGLLSEIEAGRVVSTTELSVTVDGSGLTIHPTLIASYRNRMLYAGDPIYPNFVFFSNPDAPLTIAADQVIRVGRGDGGNLAAIVIAGTTGGDSPAESIVVFLKDRQLWIFRGDLPTAGTNTGQWDLHLLSRSDGCINHRTVAVTPQGVMWAGYESVYLMPSVGALPIDVGRKIGPALKTVPPALRYRMRAVYYDGFYRLMLERGPETLSRTHQFWADMRTPGKITWWGPMTGGNWADFYADHRPGVSSRLLAPVAADAIPGRLYALDMSQHYEAVATDLGLDAADGIVLPMLRSKEYDFGDANLRKIIEAAELNFWNDRNRGVTVRFIGDISASRELTYNAGGSTLGNTLPTGALNSLHQQMNFSAQVGGRTVTRTLQLQVAASSLGSDTDVGPFQIQEIVMRLRRIQRRVA